MNKQDTSPNRQSSEQKVEIVQRVGVTSSSRKIQRTSQQTVSQTTTPKKSQQRPSQPVELSTSQKKQVKEENASQKAPSHRISRTSGTQSVNAFQAVRSQSKLVQQQSRQSFQEPEKQKEVFVKSIVRIAQRHARYKLIDGFNGLRLNYYKTSISGYKTVKLLDIGNKIIFRWKNNGWMKLLQNRNLSRKREQACKRMSFIFNAMSLRLRRLVLQKMRGNTILVKSREAQSVDQSPNKKSSRANQNLVSPKSLKTSKQSQLSEGTLLQKMVLSQQAIVPLKKCQKYDRRTFFELSTTQLKQAFEAEKKRIQQLKNSDKSLKGKQFDNELLIMVLLNHVSALLHFNEDKEKLESKLALQAQKNTNTLSVDVSSNVSPTNKEQGGSFNAGNSRRYEQTARQIEASDVEIKSLLDEKETDYDELVRVLRAQVQKFKKNKNDKIVLSRIHLSQIIINLVANLSKGQIPSSKEMTQHHYVELVDELVNKVKQLSSISEQIPQLQTFKRNLDLTEVSHEQYFIRIVDVLIALHHRVNQLLRLRPEDMMTAIDNYRNQCKNIDNLTSIFIENADSQTEELQVIVFNPKKGSHIEQFYPIHKNITSMAKLLIKERDYCIKSEEIIERLKVVVQIFWNVMSGLKSFEREWRIAKANTDVSDVQRQIFLILDECLQIFNDRLIIVQKRAQQAEQMLQRKKNETSLYHEKLETEINALLSDFQSVTLKNEELEQFVNRLMNEKQQLANQLKILRANSAKATKSPQKPKKPDVDIEKIERLEKDNRDLRSELSKLKTEMNKKSRESQRLSRQSSHQFERRIAILQDENQHLIKQRDLNKEKINGLNERLIVTTQQCDARGYQIERISRSLQSMRVEYQQYENKSRLTIRDLQSKIVQKSIQTTVIQRQTNLEEQFGKLQGRLNVALNEEGKYRAQLARLKEENIEINRRLDEQWSNQSAVSELSMLMREKHSLQERLKLSSFEIQGLKEKIEAFCGENQGNLDEIQRALRQKQYQIKTLRAENEANLSKIRTLNLVIQENKSSVNPDTMKQLQVLRIQLRDFAIFREQNQSYRNKFIKDQAYILYLEEQVRSLEDVVNVLSEQQNNLSQNYSMLSTKLRYLSQGKAATYDGSKDQEIQRLKMEIAELRSSGIKRVTEHTEIIQQGKNQTTTYVSQQNSSSAQVSNLQGQIKNLNVEISSLLNRENSYQAEMHNLQQIMTSIQTQFHERETNYHMRIAELQGEMNHMKDIIDRERQMHGGQTNQSTRILDLEHEISHLRETIDNMARQFHERQTNYHARIVQLEGEINHLRQVIDNIQRQNGRQTNYNPNIAQLEGEISNLNGFIENMQRQFHEVENRYQLRIFELENSGKSASTGSNELQALELQLKGFWEQQISNRKKEFLMKEEELINQIGRLNQILEKTINQRHQVRREHHQNIDINGATLEQLIQTIDMDNPIILDKINQLVRENTISYDLERVMPPQLKKDVENFIMINQTLIGLTVNLTSDRERMLSVLRNYPNPEHLTEFLFRMLIDFAGIPDQTLEANQVIDTLFGIRESRRGGQYFVGLQQFTNAFFEHDILPRRFNQVNQPVTETHHQVTVIRSVPYDNNEHYHHQ